MTPLSQLIISNFYPQPYSVQDKVQAQASAQSMWETASATNLATHYIGMPACYPPLEFITTSRYLVILDSAKSASGTFKYLRVGILFNKSTKENCRVAVLFTEKPSKFDIRERSLLQEFEGSGIVPKLLDYCEFQKPEIDPNGSVTIKITPVLIEELCTGGDLKQLARNKPSIELVSFIAYQALLITRTFHSAGLAHRDIKPANFLLKGDDKIVIGDIGSACKFKTTDQEVALIAGTPRYNSPESALLLITQHQRSSNKPPADIWAVGATIAELLNHKELCTYFHSNIKGLPVGPLLLYLASLSTPPEVPRTEHPIAQLTAKLLHPNPSKRPSAEQALLDPLLRKSLLSSTPFMSALANERVTITNAYKDLLGEDFEKSFHIYQNQACALYEEAAQTLTRTHSDSQDDLG